MSALLGFDTATPDTVVALAIDGGEPAELRHTPGPGERPGHAAQLLPLAGALLDRAGLGFGDLGRIGVGVGPGTFTGLRIGLASARALGFALSVPVHGVGTLDALLCGDGVDVACIDARRGEVFCLGPGIEPQAIDPEALAALLPAGATVAGDGAVRYRDALSAAHVPPDDSPLHLPHARHHAALHATAGPPEPCYLRAPDAERNLAMRAAG